MDGKKRCRRISTGGLVFMGIMLVCLAVWAAAVIYVNATSRDTVYKYYDTGDSVDYKGFDIKVCSHEGYNEEELRDKYGITKDMLGYMYDIYTEVVWIEFTKTDDNEAQKCGAKSISNLLGAGHCLASTAESTIEDCIVLSEKGEIDYDVLYSPFEEGETKKVGMLYSYVKENLPVKYMEHFEEYPLYLQFEDYERSQYIRRIKVN